MSSHDAIVYLTSLVAIGIIVVGLLGAIFHSILLAPVVILGLILALLVLLSMRGGYAHKIENLEKIMFFITFIVVVCSFILLYRPV